MSLAEAELEYYQREDTSIFPLFELAVPSESMETLPPVMDAMDEGIYFMIWTTTPWTIPANQAIAAGDLFTYGLYEVDGKYVIISTELVDKVFENGEHDVNGPFESIQGEQLIGAEYLHPFDGKPRRIVTADYVTLEDG